MANWLTYVEERIPILTYSFLAGGIALSGHYLGSPSSINTTVISFLGLLLFLIVLRVMDDLKDIDKDRIVHPTRPFARGLIRATEAVQAIRILLLIMLLFGCGVAVFLSHSAGIAYGVIIFYLWLMYHEFFLGKQLSQSPLLYAISHQVIIFAVSFFSIAISNSEIAFTKTSLWFGMLLFGAFFTYEICRKYDPKAHPILMTYRQVYGTTKSAGMVVIALFIAAIGAYQLGIAFQMWGVEVYTAASVLLLPRVYPFSAKPIELLAILCLALHAWAIPMDHFFVK